jgi:hypothetical protein
MSPARTAARRSQSRRARTGKGRAGPRRPAAGGHWWPGLVLIIAVLAGIAWQADATEPARPGLCAVPLTSETVTAEQAANAATIAEVASARGLPDRAVVIALATARQESGLRNLDHGDRDSLGLFQQRPSQGWGTPEQVRDPVYAAGKFYERLVNVPNWQTGRLTEVAQTVQRSGFPEAYQKHEAIAVALTAALRARDGELDCR